MIIHWSDRTGRARPRGAEKGGRRKGARRAIPPTVLTKPPVTPLCPFPMTPSALCLLRATPSNPSVSNFYISFPQHWSHNYYIHQVLLNSYLILLCCISCNLGFLTVTYLDPFLFPMPMILTFSIQNLPQCRVPTQPGPNLPASPPTESQLMLHISSFAYQNYNFKSLLAVFSWDQSFPSEHGHVYLSLSFTENIWASCPSGWCRGKKITQ